MIPDEAVEAAAKVAVEDGAYGVPWGDASESDREDAMEKARKILEAAAPHLMAEAFAYGWREGTGQPTPVDVKTGELFHSQAEQPGWNPYKRHEATP